jgi:GntR family transcriptional regulator, rspAB operon transcriptional repressor
MKEMYKTLFERIIQGHYPPDTWLREDALSEEFHVSRTPIRQLLRQLEKDCLVQILPNRGARVLAFTVDDVEDLYEMRKSLELLALRYAAPALGIQGLMDIRSMIMECSRSDDNVKHTEADLALHNYFIEASRRRRIVATLKQQVDLLRYFREKGFSRPSEREITTEEHLRFIDALCVRDTRTAMGILEQHIENAKMRSLSNLVKNGFR